ncbi:hypothetical protein DERF_007412 [Dermatophagoides farinae]|uniref:Uncharacterized protein n=1 Tax=Dermatophagoides farinae TaxID=6954 RepID=A0A922L7Z3_DERFA|nr:hypothetical protein DERF_007412 [Dermatophagoides farinae]
MVNETYNWCRLYKNDHGNDAEHYKFIGGYLVTNMVRCLMKLSGNFLISLSINDSNTYISQRPELDWIVGAIIRLVYLFLLGLFLKFYNHQIEIRLMIMFEINSADRRRTIGKLNLESRIEFGHCLVTWTANIGSISNDHGSSANNWEIESRTTDRIWTLSCNMDREYWIYFKRDN